MKEKRIFYLCDGNVENCKKTTCHKTIGRLGCRHTTDINHALNFDKNDFPNHVSFLEKQLKKTNEEICGFTEQTKQQARESLILSVMSLLLALFSLGLSLVKLLSVL